MYIPIKIEKEQAEDSVHSNAQRRHYLDNASSERQSRMLKEDLSGSPTEPSTYEMDFTSKKDFPNVGEPRYIRPKLEPNASLKQPLFEKLNSAKVPSQGDVDKFLYVSLYQSSFNKDKPSNVPSKIPHSAVHAAGTVPSLYQDSYVNPLECVNERKLLDNNKGMRQTYMREASGL
ncbi:hypothetical protein HDU67_000747 [Dinochytrium kinnereticum]|nr:hypothetical protein HDU67_000747 [Dinochytrium kinnereticum]